MADLTKVHLVFTSQCFGEQTYIFCREELAANIDTSAPANVFQYGSLFHRCLALVRSAKGQCFDLVWLVPP